MRVEFHSNADTELAAQIRYFERRERGLGERFYNHVMQTVEWIAEHHDLPRDRGGFRRVNLKAFPFYVAYRVEGGMIRVLSVTHGGRRPGYWGSRL